jgi:hypothetical protein
MKKAEYEQTSLLRERIEQNYEDFKEETVKLDGRSVFELAPVISAVNDVYFYMTTHSWADDDEADYLLKSENPLKLIAEEWEVYMEDTRGDFGEMLTRLAGKWDEDYMTGTVAGELRDKDDEDMLLDMEDYY